MKPMIVVARKCYHPLNALQSALDLCKQSVEAVPHLGIKDSLDPLALLVFQPRCTRHTHKFLKLVLHFKDTHSFPDIDL
jgi:hypothetical protein